MSQLIFQANESHIVIPGPNFVEGRRTRFRRCLIPGEGIKTICQPSYSLNTATVKFFLFQRGEIEASRDLLLAQVGLVMNLEGITRSAAKTSPPLPCTLDSEHTSYHPHCLLTMSCPGCPVPAVMVQHSCPRLFTIVPTVITWPPHSLCPVQTDVSRLPCPIVTAVVMSQMSSPPNCTVMAVLPRLSCPV
jgi:hypothetical protein